MTGPGASGDEAPYRPSIVETVIGFVPGFLACEVCAGRGHPRVALDRVLDEYIDYGPLFVAFSGGRDSSVLLAAAVARARATDRPDPVPVTLRYPGEPLTQESTWQEDIVAHLGLTRWDVINVARGDHDLVGPVAAAALRRHGPLWPAPAVTRSTLMKAARGGVLITGEGGDEVFADGRTAVPSALVRRLVPPSRERAYICLRECLPRPLRRRHLQRTVVANLPHPWLRPPALKAFHRRLVDDLAREPLRRDRGVLRAVSARSATLGAGTYRWLAEHHQTRWLEPLRDPRFVASLAHWVGPVGPGGRTRTMTGLFSDLLPPALLFRHDKASFQHAYLGDHTWAFAQAWKGDGVPHEMVDWRALRRTWMSKEPDASASLLLHAAWLATTGAAS